MAIGAGAHRRDRRERGATRRPDVGAALDDRRRRRARGRSPARARTSTGLRPSMTARTSLGGLLTAGCAGRRTCRPRAGAPPASSQARNGERRPATPAAAAMLRRGEEHGDALEPQRQRAARRGVEPLRRSRAARSRTAALATPGRRRAGQRRRATSPARRRRGRGRPALPANSSAPSRPLPERDGLVDGRRARPAARSTKRQRRAATTIASDPDRALEEREAGALEVDAQVGRGEERRRASAGRKGRMPTAAASPRPVQMSRKRSMVQYVGGA